MTPQRFVDPKTVTSHFHLAAGDVVADLGAGTGYFLSSLSSAVGADGVVYALEIQKNLVDTIDALVLDKQFENVQTLWGDLEEPGGVSLPNGVLDAAIMVNTLFQCEDKSTAIAEVYRLLDKGGRLHLIDWSESFDGLGPRDSEVLSRQAAFDLLESGGFVFEHEFDAGAHHYGLSFQRV